MSDLIVHGGRPLSGTITPSGNKNSVLPIFCATLLTDEPVTLLNVPDITDLNKLVAFFQTQGSQISWDRAAGTMRVDHSSFRSNLADDELPQDMRSTVLLYPALLRRLGKLTIRANTKGCSLGVREIDPHLEILRALGTAINDGPPRLPPAARRSSTPPASLTCRSSAPPSSRWAHRSRVLAPAVSRLPA
jgi:UDP-N-acetylglucosamine 1-carboxyvinyltransferase